MTQHLLVTCFLVALSGCSVRASGWSYSGTTGPSEWPTSYPNCGGQRQSPIDIDSASASYADGLGLDFTNYDQPSTGEFTVTNNGHSVVVNVPTGSGISILHGLLPYNYTLEQFHFHWGSDVTKGSEHAIDGQYFPLEIHFVHYNSDLYNDVNSAANQTRGLAVLGVLVEASDTGSIKEIDDLISHFSEVSYEGDSTTMPSFSINALLPQSSDYFRYQGSLTTPPCYESVIWSVFSTRIQFTPKQLDAFRQLHSNVAGDPDEALVDNDRPVQPLNGRTVLKSFP